jgi:hypothetical protein
MVIADMIFNMGYSRLAGFKNMKTAVLAGDYKTAAREMQYSSGTTLSAW